MQVEIEGRIIKVFELRSGISARSGNEWRRQDYVIETPGQYPRKCLFTVADTNIELFNLQEGANVKVTISIDAHEYNGRWFNDFRAIAVGNPTATVPPAEGPQIGVPQAPPATAPATDSDPFSGGISSKLPWDDEK